MLKLVEESSGVGQLEFQDDVIPEVKYDVARYQGFSESGLPVPGLFRLEGSINMGAIGKLEVGVGSDLILRLDDGRALRITLADGEGRILTEGHGPSRCTCC